MSEPQVYITIDTGKGKPKSTPSKKTQSPSAHSSPKVTKGDVNKVVYYLSELLPIPVFLLAIVCVFFVQCNDMSLFAHLCYFFIVIMHLARVVKSFTKRSFANENVFKKILCNRNAHYLVVACVFWWAHLTPILYYIAYIVLSLVKVTIAVDRELAPQAGDFAKTLRDTTATIRNCVYIHYVRAGCEILLAFYLFFCALFTFNGQLWISFLVFFVSIILYCTIADKFHKEIYNFIEKQLRQLANQNQNISQYIMQFIKYCQKIPELARQLYPIGFLREHFQ